MKHFIFSFVVAFVVFNSTTTFAEGPLIERYDSPGLVDVVADCPPSGKVLVYHGRLKPIEVTCAPYRDLHHPQNPEQQPSIDKKTEVTKVVNDDIVPWIGLGFSSLWTNLGPARAPGLLGGLSFRMGDSDTLHLDVAMSYFWWDGDSTVTVGVGPSLKFGAFRIGALVETLVMGDGDGDFIAGFSGVFQVSYSFTEWDGFDLRLLAQARGGWSTFVDPEDGQADNSGTHGGFMLGLGLGF